MERECLFRTCSGQALYSAQDAAKFIDMRIALNGWQQLDCFDTPVSPLKFNGTTKTLCSRRADSHFSRPDFIVFVTFCLSVGSQLWT